MDVSEKKASNLPVYYMFGSFSAYHQFFPLSRLPLLCSFRPITLTAFFQELSDMTAIKAEDILTTLQSLELIQYRKGQHVICADPKVLDRHLKAAGRGGLDVDVSKLIWTPYKEQN